MITTPRAMLLPKQQLWSQYQWICDDKNNSNKKQYSRNKTRQIAKINRTNRFPRRRWEGERERERQTERDREREGEWECVWERKRERERDTHIYMYVYIYIFSFFRGWGRMIYRYVGGFYDMVLRRKITFMMLSK